jgi:hypothetical protein
MLSTIPAATPLVFSAGRLSPVSAFLGVFPGVYRIPYTLYFAEKAKFAGILIGAIFYGISTLCVHAQLICQVYPFGDRHSPIFYNVWAHCSVLAIARGTGSGGDSWSTL